MGFLVSLLAGFIPMFIYAWFLYFMDRYEKEPIKLLFGVFTWGAVFAAGASFIINTLSSVGIYLITRSEYATQFTLSTLIAPVVEETLKGMAVLIIFLLFRSEFDSLLDGVIYGGITALGFAATENTWYIYQFGYLENHWHGLLDLTLIRVLLVGWQHPFYTAFIGLGFAFSRRTSPKPLKWAFPFIGWFIAICFHLIHNLFSSLLISDSGKVFSAIWDWSGYIGLLILIFVLIRREQDWMKVYLSSERDQKLITDSQYKIACSAWLQTKAFYSGFIHNKYRNTRRFYQACGDLMHKKRQIAKHGNKLGATTEIQRLRSELQDLAENI